MTLRVAVIGAGAAGLCALRHLTSRQQEFQAVCFEINNQVGGTWIYTDKTGQDEHGQPIHSSMYKNLRTNLPKEVMAFPDFPFRTDLPSFISHEEVEKYLIDYAKHYDLFKYIKFCTLVTRVHPQKTPVNPEEDRKVNWEVTYKHLEDKDEQHMTENFDAVMLCNGHYSLPLEPNIPGLDKFKGQIRHSHTYRYPTEFTGQRVVCLGAASSGQDISVDISSEAKQVYLSHRKEQLKSYLPPNVTQKPGIRHLTEKTAVFETGDEEEIDCLLLCTGYYYSFPFLTDDCHVSITDERIAPLYKHVIHTDFTSLSFIGILKTICPFPNFHNQVLFVLASLTGKMKLPSKLEMDKDTEAELKWRMETLLFPVRYAHTMGTLQWKYNDDLADLAGFDRIPRVVQILYDDVHITRVQDIVHYKSVNYKLTGPETYVQCET